MLDATMLDAVKVLGGSLLTAVPAYLTLRHNRETAARDHRIKERDAENSAAESAGAMLLGGMREMRERIDMLERQLLERDKAWAAREREFAAAINHLEGQVATLKVIADMDPGPERDRQVDRLLKRMAKANPPAPANDAP